MANDPSNHLARLVYDKGLTTKLKKRINYLVEANNELMKELEQWERVGTRLEKATTTPLTQEESQIVMMPWLKEHIKE
jgi:hypothetical protein